MITYSENNLSIYRGVVESNEDPMSIGRCKVRTSVYSDGVTTESLPWAMPITNSTINSRRGSVNVPDVGDMVWVLFEGSDKNYPVYIGGVYATSDIPVDNSKVTLYTEDGSSITYDRSSSSYRINKGNHGLIISDQGVTVVGNLLVSGNIITRGSLSSSSEVIVPDEPFGTGTADSGIGGGGSVTPIPDIPDLPGTLEYDKAVYDILITSSYKGKAYEMSVVYALFRKVYEKNFTIGLMANVAHEGYYGVVEYAFSKSHLFGFYLPSGGTTVASVADCDYLINWRSSTKGQKRQMMGGINYQEASCGIGIVGWSFGLRVEVATLYKQYCKTFSQSELGACEMMYILNQFKGTYSWIPTDCIGKSAGECASYICRKYEKPANTETQAVKRAETASNIASLLSNIE